MGIHGTPHIFKQGLMNPGSTLLFGFGHSLVVKGKRGVLFQRHSRDDTRKLGLAGKSFPDRCNKGRRSLSPGLGKLSARGVSF